jgi:hypothetical protein
LGIGRNCRIKNGYLRIKIKKGTFAQGQKEANKKTMKKNFMVLVN